MGEARNSDLSHSWQRLIRRMQQLDFGRIERLQVRKGDPVFDPPPRFIREVKLGADDSPGRKHTEDFLLKDQVRDLVARLGDMRTGEVLVLEIKHGLPFRMTLKEDDA